MNQNELRRPIPEFCIFIHLQMYIYSSCQFSTSRESWWNYGRLPLSQICAVFRVLAIPLSVRDLVPLNSENAFWWLAKEWFLRAEIYHSRVWWCLFQQSTWSILRCGGVFPVPDVVRDSRMPLSIYGYHTVLICFRFMFHEKSSSKSSNYIHTFLPWRVSYCDVQKTICRPADIVPKAVKTTHRFSFWQ